MWAWISLEMCVCVALRLSPSPSVVMRNRVIPIPSDLSKDKPVAVTPIGGWQGGLSYR